MQNLLMQGLPSRYHREHMLIRLNHTLHQNRLPIIPLQKLLHLPLQLLATLAFQRLDAHGFRELDEIGVVHARVGVARVVEEVLPLEDHALEFVVEDEDFDPDGVLRGGGEFHGGHAEGGVAVDVDDDLLWGGNLCADTRGEPESHCL